jgi:hypothetical protein
MAPRGNGRIKPRSIPGASLLKISTKNRLGRLSEQQRMGLATAWQAALTAVDELPDNEKQKYSKQKTKTAWLNAKVRELITLEVSDKPGYMRHCHSCPVWTQQSTSSVPVARLAKYWFDNWKASGHCKDNHVGGSGMKRAASLTQQEQDQCAQALAQNNPQLRRSRIGQSNLL